ncbi:Dihydroorotate dehydrogenase (quinone), mitochondrial, partial [Neophaeococcomyces mojaviensis]
TGAIPPVNVAEKPDSEKQSLIKLPTKKFYDQPIEEQDKFRSSPDGPEAKPSPRPEPSKSSTTDKNLERKDSPKVIFATGGITNGKQALEVLDAGASVAMVYTALVYGGVGTISRIKDEMRQELAARARK